MCKPGPEIAEAQGLYRQHFGSRRLAARGANIRNSTAKELKLPPVTQRPKRSNAKTSEQEERRCAWTDSRKGMVSSMLEDKEQGTCSNTPLQAVSD